MGGRQYFSGAMVAGRFAVSWRAHGPVITHGGLHPRRATSWAALRLVRSPEKEKKGACSQLRDKRDSILPVSDLAVTA